MPARPDLGPPPHLGYTASTLDRAAEIRSDVAALAKAMQHPQAGVYLIGGEQIVMRQNRATCDPLFAPDEAAALGAPRETVFLGLAEKAPRFGIGLAAANVEAAKARGDLKVADLRSIAVQGLV